MKRRAVVLMWHSRPLPRVTPIIEEYVANSPGALQGSALDRGQRDVADVRVTEATPVPWGARHYLIYIDGAGAYEFLAASYEQMPELPATGGISL